MKTQPQPSNLSEYLSATILGMIGGVALVMIAWIVLLYLGGAFTLQ